jgi:methyltransferase (TIGR00027 family)
VTPATIFLPSRDDGGIWTTFDGATAIGPQFQTTAAARLSGLKTYWPSPLRRDKKNGYSVYGDAMQPGRFSRTAEFMALFRALESERPAEALFRDAFAVGFISPSLRRLVRCSATPIVGWLLCRFIDNRWPGARTSGVARTRLIDDWVAEGVANDCRQIVVLGAGFDSRAWRLPGLSGLPVFEVDHPATAAEKSARITALGADPSRVVSVSLDFDRDRLSDHLAASGFDAKKVTTVIWEGVTNYLTEKAVFSVLAWMGTLAPGSRLAFTYIDRGVLTEPTSFKGAANVLLAVSSAGEPWTFGFMPESLPHDLARFGLRLVEDLGADDYRARYFGKKARTMRGYAFYRAALVVVANADA